MATTSPVTVTALAARLRVVIARSTRRLRQEGGGDLSPALFAALATIDHHGPLTPSEIAERERVTRPTATRFIAKLHARGLVGRTGDPADKRSSLIAITDEGSALLAEWRTRRTAFLSRKLETMSPEDRATIERAVELLEEIVETPPEADR
jgi:DNA-binding MarR family transcriptional regulator